MMKKKRIWIGSGVIVFALVYLIATAVSDSRVYYLTVDEALARGSALQGEPVRIMGKVDGESVRWDANTLVLTMKVAAENGQTLDIVYRGAKPDTVVDGAEAIVEGRVNSSGVMRAEKLMVACPSKYEAAPEASAGRA